MNLVTFNIPLNVRKFLFDYEHSAFIECNEDLAKKTLSTYFNYFQNPSKNEFVSHEMKHITDSLENLYKDYWLSDGTLLGKFTA